MLTVIKRSEAVAKIRSAGPKIFGATVRKRSGDIREFRVRLASSVNVGKSGGELGYNAAKKGLIPVYLMAGDENRNTVQSENFRMIAEEGIMYLNIDGESYEVVD